MERRVFQAGDLIIRQGEHGREGYRILKGRVEVFLERDGRELPIGRLEGGEIFGEMAMIDDKPRSASVRALERTEVDIINSTEFNEMILSDPRELIPFLKSFFERLRKANDSQAAGGEAAAEISRPLRKTTAELKEGNPIRLIAANEETRRRIIKPEIDVIKFPFRMGRWCENFQADVFLSNDLLIRDDPPFQISRNHCAIECEGNRFYVLDRGSAYGTILNQKQIGGTQSMMHSPLQPGENHLRLGGRESPYEFLVVV
jgi:CRP-like cAMP-binding protein